jgi:hypothetical protein
MVNIIWKNCSARKWIPSNIHINFHFENFSMMSHGPTTIDKPSYKPEQTSRRTASEPFADHSTN